MISYLKRQQWAEWQTSSWSDCSFSRLSGRQLKLDLPENWEIKTALADADLISKMWLWNADLSRIIIEKDQRKARKGINEIFKTC